MNSRTQITVCAVICCLLLAVIGSIAFADHTNTSPYFKIYQQNSPDDWDHTHNIMWCNVMADGTCYAGGNTCAGQQWRDEQINGTAVINWGTRTAETAKSIVPFRGHLYNGGANGAFIEQDAWNTPYADMHVLVNTATGFAIGGANGIGPGTAANNKQNAQSVATDGQYIYSNDCTSSPSDLRNLIHKWKIDETNWTCTDETGWPVSIGAPATCRLNGGLCIWNNKIYAINKVSPFGIYEIDCATGAYSLIIPGTAYTNQGAVYSVARYGNDIFVPQYTGNVPAGTTPTWVLHTFHFDGTSWGNAVDYDLGIENPFYTGTSNQQIGYFGVGLKGDGVNAKYMWLTSAGGQMSFWDLSPCFAPTTLEDANNWKNGYPVLVGGCIVTALGAAGDGFYVENASRTKGAFIKYAGALPPLNHVVTIKGSGSLVSGVRSITATEVTAGDPATVKPLFITNKAMAPATGSAGLANDGLLVTVSGKVTYFDINTAAFYIDDGSAVPSDIAGVTGIKVLKADGTAPDTANNFILAMDPQVTPCYAVVTGVVKPQKAGSNIIRTIGARSADDVVITPLP